MPAETPRSNTFPEKLRWRRHLVQHVTERLRASSEVGEKRLSSMESDIRPKRVCAIQPKDAYLVHDPVNPRSVAQAWDFIAIPQMPDDWRPGDLVVVAPSV